jgi:hypothetical protein
MFISEKYYERVKNSLSNSISVPAALLLHQCSAATIKNNILL